MNLSESADEGGIFGSLAFCPLFPAISTWNLMMSLNHERIKRCSIGKIFASAVFVHSLLFITATVSATMSGLKDNAKPRLAIRPNGAGNRTCSAPYKENCELVDLSDYTGIRLEDGLVVAQGRYRLPHSFAASYETSFLTPSRDSSSANSQGNNVEPGEIHYEEWLYSKSRGRIS